VTKLRHHPTPAVGRFQARYTTPTGVRVTAPKTFAAKAHAQAWLSDRCREIDTGSSKT
jgi:hypothetical protein